jgi:hypothetical protein
VNKLIKEGLMEIDLAEKAEKYYQLVSEKNVEGIKDFLDTHVEFYSPLSSLKGKEAVVQATTGFMHSFSVLKIKEKFGSKDKALIIYHIDIPELVKDFPGASLLTFYQDKIVRIELFFDASPFKG